MITFLLVTAFLCCFGVVVANGQSAGIAGKSIPALQQEKVETADFFRFSTQTIKKPVDQTYPALTTVFQTQTTPKIYSFEELAFFCKIEVELEKATGLPVKFRLGSVPYVDRLEGKTRH